MQIITDVKLDFNDVLIQPMLSDLESRSQVAILRTFKFPHSPKVWTGFPVVASNMDTVGTLKMAASLAEHQMVTAIHKFYTKDEIQKATKQYSIPAANLAITTGIREEDWTRLKQLQKIKHLFDFIVIDVPNGYIKSFVSHCAKVRTMFPDHIIVAGNVVTPNITEQLIMNGGVDIVKVGIGPGDRCTTRKVTGVGYPQLSAIIETSNVAHGVKGHVMSDGGCRTPGDVSKAFCAGSDFVMLGSMLAGHAECLETANLVVLESKLAEHEVGGEISKYDYIHALNRDPNFKVGVEFYGMSSSQAMKKYYGSVANHRAPEGISKPVEFRGPVHNTVQEIKGGVRSCATYIGAHTLKEMSKRAVFVKVR